MGSSVAAAWIAQLAFWTLIVLGLRGGALRKRTATIFAALWLVGHNGLPRIAWWTGPFMTSWVAVLNIALVLVVFRGDVRLT